jgi:hypothetical protein
MVPTCYSKDPVGHKVKRILLFVLLIVLVLPSEASALTHVFVNASSDLGIEADAYLTGSSLGAPDTKYGSTTNLLLWRRSNGIGRSIIRVNVSSMPVGVTYLNATINLYMYQNGLIGGSAYGPEVVYAYYLNNTCDKNGGCPWIETNITYNSQPSYYAANLLGSTTISDQAGQVNMWVPWDVKTGVLWVRGNGSESMSVLLKNSEASGPSQDEIDFYSRNYTTNTTKRPYFEAYWTNMTLISFTLNQTTINVGAPILATIVTNANTETLSNIWVTANETNVLRQSAALNTTIAVNGSNTMIFNVSNAGWYYITPYVNDSGNGAIQGIPLLVLAKDPSGQPSATIVDPTPAAGLSNNVAVLPINVTAVTTANNYSLFYDFNNSIIGYYPMDYYNTTDVFDKSPYGVNLKYYNMASQNVTYGRYGYAMDFQGSSTAYINTTDNALHEPSRVSVSFWMNRDNVNQVTYGRIFEKGAFGTNPWMSYDIEFNNAADNDLNCNIGATDNTNVVANSGAIITPSVWHHIVCVYNGTHMVIYVDNVMKQATAGTKTIKYDANGFNIGKQYYGKIDDLALFSRALTAMEVSAIYSASPYFYNTYNLTNNTLTNYTAYISTSAGEVFSTAYRNYTYNTDSGGSPPADNCVPTTGANWVITSNCTITSLSYSVGNISFTGTSSLVLVNSTVIAQGLSTLRPISLTNIGTGMSTLAIRYS